jgi:dTDP-4-amino-4,6-dideoxygalactose transaminase
LNAPFPLGLPSPRRGRDGAARAVSNQVNYWTGQEGREFEREFAGFAGTEYAIAVSNGTTALDLALKGLGIGEGEGRGRAALCWQKQKPQGYE